MHATVRSTEFNEGRLLPGTTVPCVRHDSRAFIEPLEHTARRFDSLFASVRTDQLCHGEQMVAFRRTVT